MRTLSNSEIQYRLRVYDLIHSEALKRPVAEFENKTAFKKKYNFSLN